MSTITLNSISLNYQGAPLFSDFHFHVPAHKWTALLGPSGVGKTTLLRIMAGLETACNGEVIIDPAVTPRDDNTAAKDDNAVTGSISYLSQSFQCFPWLNVLDNVLISSVIPRSSTVIPRSSTVIPRVGGRSILHAIRDLMTFRFKHPLGVGSQSAHGSPAYAGDDGRTAKDDGKTARDAAKSILKNVGLENHLHKYPHQLSTGMKQRLALARVLFEDRPIILMDEPFSALDAITKEELQTLTRQYCSKKTAVLVTHDPLEALQLCDHIYVLGELPVKAHFVTQLTSKVPRALTDKDVSHYLPILMNSLRQMKMAYSWES